MTPAPALGRRFEHVHVLPSGKRITYTVQTVPGTIPWEQGWPRVEDMLLSAMLRKLPELLEAERQRKIDALHLPDYIEGGI